MSIIRRLDIWLGKTLFHPPIILICQRTRQTQYAVHRALWFFSACDCCTITGTANKFWPFSAPASNIFGESPQ